MVMVSKAGIEELSSVIRVGGKNKNKNKNKNKKKRIRIPEVDLSKADAETQIVKACEEFGFFKVVNHGVPIQFINRLEKEAANFFSLPLKDKQMVGPPNPSGLGYGINNIGNNGDVGWIEYLLMNTNNININQTPAPTPDDNNPLDFRCAVGDYMREVKRMTCEVMELMADGLRLEARDVFSKLLRDENSDSLFRVNHYPPCPQHIISNNNNMIGFGEHTDPQIISVLRSNNTCGLEILVKDGEWLPVPPDEDSFFFNVGDSLQVMTNGRFKSVRHRVITNKLKSRMSMIYFGGPPMSEKIGPLAAFTGGDNQRSLYKEFTWFDYKSAAYKSRLADNRLLPFHKLNKLLPASS